MAVDILQLTAVQVYKFSAAQTFQVEMFLTFLIIFDILITGAGFSVDDKFPYQPGFHQPVKLTINRGSAHGSAFGAEICAYFLNAGVLFSVAYEKVHQLFFLRGVITRFFSQALSCFHIKVCSTIFYHGGFVLSRQSDRCRKVFHTILPLSAKKFPKSIEMSEKICYYKCMQTDFLRTFVHRISKFQEVRRKGVVLL